MTPRLAEVEADEVTANEQRMWALRRPSAGPDSGVLLSAEGVAIALFFDGTRDLRQVQKAVYDRYAQLLYIERIHELATALNDAGLFDKHPLPPPPRSDSDPNVTPVHRSSPRLPRLNLRAAVHAGSGYDADPRRLADMLRSFFTHPEGPGGLPGLPKDTRRLVGLVVPHIDLDRGGPIYAHAYRAVAERSDAELFVIFGTAHASPEEMFTLTRRHYDTPFGPLPTDTQVVNQLHQELGDGLFRNESVHDEEHSIEFQAVYLRFLFPNRPITILPILCSSLYPTATAGKRPKDEPVVEKFLAALAKVTQGRKVTFVAAADLSHVGKLYGDPSGPTADTLKALELKDLASLERVRQGSAEAWFDHVSPDGDTRRICGLTPIYMMLRMTGGLPGRVVKYSQWFGAKDASAVTCGVVTIDKS